MMFRMVRQRRKRARIKRRNEPIVFESVAQRAKASCTCHTIRSERPCHVPSVKVGCVYRDPSEHSQPLVRRAELAGRQPHRRVDPIQRLLRKRPPTSRTQDRPQANCWNRQKRLRNQQPLRSDGIKPACRVGQDRSRDCSPTREPSCICSCSQRFCRFR